METRSWTIPAGAPLTFDATKYILTASSSTNTDDKLANYPVTLTESAVYSGTTFSANTPFTVIVTDPCLTTSITAFTLATFSLENGKSKEVLFNRPTDTAAVAVSKPNICGARIYTVKEVINGAHRA